MSIDRYTICIGGLEAEVVVSPIRNLHIGVYPPNGRVRVAAPTQMTKAAVHGALALRLPWIRKQISQFERQPRESSREFITGESHWFKGRRYRLRTIGHHASSDVKVSGHHIDVMVRGSVTRPKVAAAMERWRRTELAQRACPVIAMWAQKIGLTAPSVKIKRMQTRWGTCSAHNNTIYLNIALSRLSQSCLEYISLHELIHLVVPNHGEEFVAMMDLHMPQWRAVRMEMNELPYAGMARLSRSSCVLGRTN